MTLKIRENGVDYYSQHCKKCNKNTWQSRLGKGSLGSSVRDINKSLNTGPKWSGRANNVSFGLDILEIIIGANYICKECKTANRHGGLLNP